MFTSEDNFKICTNQQFTNPYSLEPNKTLIKSLNAQYFLQIYFVNKDNLKDCKEDKDCYDKMND